MLKKVLALALAGAMVLGSMNLMAFAAVGDLSVNGSLKVAGLDEGDTAVGYQVIKWDSENEPQGWVWNDAVVDTAELDDDDLAAITGVKQEDDTYPTDGAGQITAELASKIANALLDNPESVPMTVAKSGDTYAATASVEDAGLYMVIVTAAAPGTMYNPIFVAANWVGSDETPDESNEIAVSANELTYSGNGMAKKSTIQLDKTSKAKDPEDATAMNSYTTDIGEKVDFTVTTKIPKFGDNYTAPVFQLHDTLTNLVLTGEPVVKAGSDTLTKTDAYTDTYDATTKNAYVLTNGADGDTEYTIKFTEGYLDSVAAAGQDIVITYTAKVTGDALNNVNPEKNTVDLTFSNGPDDTTGKGLLRDETNHFTFSLDANLLGGGGNGVEDSTTEAIKVGLDEAGNPIVSEETRYYANTSKVKHAPLEGAEFTLYKEDGETPYTNDLYPSGVTVTSDSTGRITIKGLDVGTYYLKETKAPAGYIKQQDAVKVEITADITENVTVKEEVNNAGETVKVTYKTNKLNSYSVKVNNSTTTYTFNNPAESKIEVSKIESIDASDNEIVNTKGVELPSTGGIGTTIFYAGGAVLVLLAGVLLVSKRRIA